LKNTVIVIILISVGVYNYLLSDSSTYTNTANEKQSTKKVSQSITLKNNKDIINAYKNRQSDVQVNASGKVRHILPDDNKGSKHQKFILEITPNFTILIAHNIDLSKKLNSIKRGDSVEFFGEYEYNKKGGLVHWTHKDPKGYHVDGWLKHKGLIYE